MFNWQKIARYIPAVEEPVQKLTFREKIKWTFIILVLFYILGSITVWGINPEAVAQFEFLEIVFGSRFGSLITLGIGPIVTASIILQLFVGSKIINWDTNTEEGKAKFQSAEKILMIIFCFIEAVAYVLAGAVPPASSDPFLISFVIFELAVGGIIIIFMDGVCSKWGIGSGVSLFIAAGVAKTIIVRIFNPLTQSGGLPTIGEPPAGIMPLFITSLMEGMPSIFILLPLISTILVFILTVYIQDVRVELPLSFSLPFGKIAARRWPIKFLYTSNIPVILTAAVLANLQVLGRLLYQRGISFLGTYNESGVPTSGLLYYISHPSGDVGIIIVTILASIFALIFIVINIRVWKKHIIKFSFLGAIIGGIIGYFLISYYNLPVITSENALRALIYVTIYMIGSTIFSIFWVNTAGMDAKSLAEQFKASSIMIPGFRHDPRIVEKVLDKYIPALTVLGGAFVGFLAAFADLTSAIGSGTGILLTVMIIYQFYEQITAQHYDEIPEKIRKLLGV
ncbi:MAG: preprotein translocase subunit SecY [Candidatus Aenigmatarchaeota archaeon]